MSNGKSKSPDPRLVILGAAGVGKSALVVRFITRRFIWEYDPTLESTYKHHTTIDEEGVSMDILDTAGDDFSNQREGQVRWGDGFILVYSINNRRSFEDKLSFQEDKDSTGRSEENQHAMCNYRQKRTYFISVRFLLRKAKIWPVKWHAHSSASNGGGEILQAFHELCREVKRRKALLGKTQRRSSAQQVKQVISKVLRGIQSGS